MSVLSAEALFPYNRYIEIPPERIFDVFSTNTGGHSQAKTCRAGLHKKYIYTTSTSDTLKNDANVNAVVRSLPLTSKKEFCCFNITWDVPTQ